MGSTSHLAGVTSGRKSKVERLIERSAGLLKAAPANVFIADMGLRIVWMSDQAAASMRRLEPTLREVFGVSANDILGGSIHRFHRDPGHVEDVLAGRAPGISMPHHATFSFGEITLRTNINRIYDRNEVVGYIVVWDDVSELHEANRQVSELASVLDAAAIAVSDLALSVTENARHAQDAAQTAHSGTEAARAAAGAVSDLGSTSASIADVAREVGELAEQTRMLALNATIEAARAGEAGRGFAVVAQEVRALAAASANSAEEIAHRVAAVRESVAAVVAEIEGIGASTTAIEDAQTMIAAVVEEQSTTTTELAAQITQAAASTATVRSALKSNRTN